MTVKKDDVAHPDDEIVTISEDGKKAETKKAPTEEERKKAAKTEAEEDDEGDESHEDERNAAGGESAEDLEARRTARRDARRARKQHRREREEQIQAENADLRERLARVEGQVGSVVQNSGTQTLAIVDQRLSEAAQARDLADQALEAAITKNDGKAAREAIKARDLATEAIRQLGQYRANFEAHSKQNGTAQAQGQGPSPQLLNHAKQFKLDNPWVELDPTKADDDSKAVHRLDASVKAAGYDPATPEYWEELQDRVDRKFPAKLTAADQDEEDDEQHASGRNGRAAQQQQRASGRRGPAMSGGRGNGRLGKNDIVIPAAVVQAAKEAGYWNDPAERADFIKRWKASEAKYSAKT